MTTFTFRAPEGITSRLTSSEMRSWMNDFVRQPHILPPDPGSGYGRVSLTLPADTVNAIATYSKCATSSALRRIAVERLGVTTPSVTLTRPIGSSGKILNRATSHDNSQTGYEIAGAALICFVLCMILAGILVCVLAFRRKRHPIALCPTDVESSPRQSTDLLESAKGSCALGDKDAD
jgi:hypothetical protein